MALYKIVLFHDVFVYLCISCTFSFVNYCSGWEPVADLDIPFIVESKPLGPKLEKTLGKIKIFKLNSLFFFTFHLNGNWAPIPETLITFILKQLSSIFLFKKINCYNYLRILFIFSVLTLEIFTFYYWRSNLIIIYYSVIFYFHFYPLNFRYIIAYFPFLLVNTILNFEHISLNFKLFDFYLTFFFTKCTYKIKFLAPK